MSEIDAFRLQVRDWLEENCPPSQRQAITRQEQVWGGKHKHFPSDEARLWFERMCERGWTVPEWPQQYGGGGLDEQQAKVLREEMKRLGCRTPLYDLGIWMLGPALLEFGNDTQRAFHLPKIAKGEVRWC